MKNILIFLLLIIFVSCKEIKESRFSLSGTTNELKDGTVLYLFDSSKEIIIDSIKVQNNSFNFNTNLPSHPFLAILKNEDNSLFKRLWLENKPMTFNASNQDFENAVIFGSNAETEYANLYKAIPPLSRKEREELLMDFIKIHSDDILGPYVLSEWYISWKKERTEPLYQLLSEKNKSSFYGKKIHKYIELNQNPTIGEHYVDFELTDQYGKQIKLSNLKGRLVLLEFWASWCAPCRKDNKDLVTFYEKFKPLGFDIFHVSLDQNKQHWLDAIKKDNLEWANASDLNGWNNEAAVIYGINLLPSNFLIDENGIIIGQDIRGKKLEQKISEMLE